jgi:pimeloyl-ACP methyl ester carboxylesterase
VTELVTTLIDTGDAVIEARGAGDGELVVLVPSLGRAATDYDMLAADLIAAGYRTCAINLRSTGASRGRMDGATFYDLAGDLLRVVAQLGAPAHLIGYTIGNRIVRCAARLQPELVRSLVLFGAGGKLGPEPEAALAGRQFMEGMRDRASRRDDELVALARRAYLSPATTPPGDFLDGWWIDQAFAQHAALVATPFDGWWEGGGRPMLALQGADDRLAPPGNGHQLARDCGDRVSVVDLAAAGHLLLLEQPQAVSRAVVAFLRALPPRFPDLV